MLSSQINDRLVRSAHTRGVRDEGIRVLYYIRSVVQEVGTPTDVRAAFKQMAKDLYPDAPERSE